MLKTEQLPEVRQRFPLVQWYLPAGILLAAVIGTWVYFVQTVQGQLVDAVTWETAGQRLQFLRGPVRTLLALLPEIVGVLAVLTFLVLTLIKKRFFASGVALVMFLAANASAQVLKHWIFLRPDLGTGIPYYTGNSLPSGHTVFASAAGFALMLVAHPRQRSWVSIVAVTLAVAVGAGTFMETWHRPADMMAGYFLAGGCALLAAGYMANRGPQENHLLQLEAGHVSPVAVWLTGIGLVISAASLVFFALAGGVAELSYPFPAFSLWHYLAGLALSTGPGVFTFGLVLWRLEAARPSPLSPAP